MEMKKPCNDMKKPIMLRGAATLGLVLCFLSCFLHGGAFAQTSTACTALTLTLTPCLPYVESGNTAAPAANCCTPLAALFTANATCLCDLAPLAQTAGVSLNQTRALEVATLCNQTVPTEVTNCLASIAPTASIPSSNGGSSPDGSYASIRAPPSLFFGSLFVALSLRFIVPS